MDYQYELYVLAIGILSTINALLAVLFFLDQNGIIYKLLVKKKKKEKNSSFMKYFQGAKR